MALSEQRLGELATIILQKKFEKDGLKLNPKEVKREISNDAKNLGIPASELAQMAKIFYKKLFDQTMAELDQIK